MTYILDEWFRYRVSLVPNLAEVVKTGKVHVASWGIGERSAVLFSTTGTGKARPAQQPALFESVGRLRWLSRELGRSTFAVNSEENAVIS